MITLQAEYKADIARLAVYLAKRDTQLVESLAKRDVDAAERDPEAAKRETRLLLVVVGTIVAVIGVATAVPGLLITG